MQVLDDWAAFNFIDTVEIVNYYPIRVTLMVF